LHTQLLSIDETIKQALAKKNGMAVFDKLTKKNGMAVFDKLTPGNVG